MNHIHLFPISHWFISTASNAIYRSIASLCFTSFISSATEWIDHEVGIHITYGVSCEIWQSRQYISDENVLWYETLGSWRMTSTVYCWDSNEHTRDVIASYVKRWNLFIEKRDGSSNTKTQRRELINCKTYSSTNSPFEGDWPFRWRSNRQPTVNWLMGTITAYR